MRISQTKEVKLAATLTADERKLLMPLQRAGLAYFLDNQLDHGFILDRQHNHTQPNLKFWCSTSATGMGLIAIALAASKEYNLLSKGEARRRIENCLETALQHVDHENGMLPHFLDADKLHPVGADTVATIDASWLFAGALWAAQFLGGKALPRLAAKLYDRVNWCYWTTSKEPSLLLHGRRKDGELIDVAWDRLNSETAFMYLLASGSHQSDAATIKGCWKNLERKLSDLAGQRILSAELGLFVHQYSALILDWSKVKLPGGVNLQVDARDGAVANFLHCRQTSKKYKTHEHFWCLSAGDGPGDKYVAYSPLEMDGTIALMASLGSTDAAPDLVLRNVREAAKPQWSQLTGRYGFSNINLENPDRPWVSRDVVGIDVGAAVMSMDNALHAGRVRKVFAQVDVVRRALAAMRR